AATVPGCRLAARRSVRGTVLGVSAPDHLDAGDVPAPPTRPAGPGEGPPAAMPELDGLDGSPALDDGSPGEGELGEGTGGGSMDVAAVPAAATPALRAPFRVLLVFALFFGALAGVVWLRQPSGKVALTAGPVQDVAGTVT